MKWLLVILAVVLVGSESTLGAQPANLPNAVIKEIKLPGKFRTFPQPITIAVESKHKKIPSGEYVVSGVVAERKWTNEELAQIKEYEGKEVFLKVTAQPIPTHEKIVWMRNDPHSGFPTNPGGYNVHVTVNAKPGQVSVVRFSDGSILATDLIEKKLASKPTKAKAK